MASPSDLDLLVQRELADEFAIEGHLRGTKVAAMYRARDLDTKRAAILWVIRPRSLNTGSTLDEFHREAALAATLEHPRLVKTYRFGATSKLLWYAMEHVTASILANVLDGSGRVRMEVCLHTVSHVASVLHYAHQRGSVHGGIGPGCVLLGADNEAILQGFGLGRVICTLDPMEARQAFGESLECVAPEWSSSLDASADQYQLAGLAYKCLTGEAPRGDMTVDEITSTLSTARILCQSGARQGAPAYVIDALARAMSKDPVERFESMYAFALDMQGGLLYSHVGDSAGVADWHDDLPDEADLEPAEVGRRVPKYVNRVTVSAGALLVAAAVFLISWLRAPESDPLVAMPAAPAFVAKDTVVEDTTTLVQLPPARPLIANRQPADSGSDSIEAGQDTAVPSIVVSVAAVPADTVAEPAPPAVPEPADSQPGETGRLFVSSTPWGQLYVDGELVGNTPVIGFAVAVGPHVVRIERDGFEPVERRIVVAAGDQLRLTGIVLRAKSP